MNGADDHDFHRVGATPPLTGAVITGAPHAGGASIHLAQVVPLPKRRTYLEAAREQGVHQEREELLVEHAELSADLARLRVKAGKPAVRSDAEVLDLSETIGINRQAFDKALADQRAEIEGRVAAICEVIAAWPLAGPWFPLFAHLLTTNATRADEVGPMLVSCGRNGEAGAAQSSLALDQFKTVAFRTSAANSNSGGPA